MRHAGFGGPVARKNKERTDKYGLGSYDDLQVTWQREGMQGNAPTGVLTPVTEAFDPSVTMITTNHNMRVCDAVRFPFALLLSCAVLARGPGLC